MAGTIIDKRHTGSDRYYSSRERFLDRNRGKIREAIDRALGESSIENIGKGGADVTLPGRGINEPFIHHGKGGVTERVMPGNKQFNAGDRVKKPQGGGGAGQGPGQGNGQGDGDDDYVFHLSEEEFFNYLYEDMQLPNLIKEGGEDAEKVRYKRSGFISEGPPNKMDLGRSSVSRISRNIAVTKPLEKKKLEKMLELRALLNEALPEGERVAIASEADLKAMLLSARLSHVEKEIDGLIEKTAGRLTEETQVKADGLIKDIADLDRKLGAVPKWNEIDLKYRRHEAYPQPITQAVMMCLMDVSFSMDEQKKNNAKLFYMLLYRFLKRNYGKVDIVFIRHTDTAEEVDEQTFFYDSASGGTTVSTCLVKMQETIEERYPLSDWNIYGAQASDGDNMPNDNAVCQEELRALLPIIQGYFYTELKDGARPNFLNNSPMNNSSLWNAYAEVQPAFADRFFMGKISEKKDIWPLFRDFFKKRESYDSKPHVASSLARFEPQEP